MTTVLVTGAGGLIGRELAQRLSSTGATVLGTSRRAGPLPHCTASYCRSFGEPLGSVLHEHRVDAVVHCAHDVSSAGAAISESGTLLWAREAGQAGAARQVFISSISARSDAPSAYARAKHRLEQHFLACGGSVFRPGLVIGMGGLFGRMVRFVQKTPLVPMIGGGRTRVYFNGIDFVCDQIASAVLNRRGPGEWNLQQPQPTSLRALLAAVREALGARTWFIPVPYYPCLAAAWVLDRCGIARLGISYENLLGLRHNDVPGIRSDFLVLGGQPEEIRHLVARAIEAEKHQTTEASAGGRFS